jgi:hypothetical protein
VRRAITPFNVRVCSGTAPRIQNCRSIFTAVASCPQRYALASLPEHAARPSRCLVRFALAEIDQRRRPTQRHLRSERQMIDTEASMRACGSWSRHRWCHGIVALGCLRPAIAPRCVIGLARSAVGTCPSTIFWHLKVEGPRPRPRPESLRAAGGVLPGGRRWLISAVPSVQRHLPADSECDPHTMESEAAGPLAVDIQWSAVPAARLGSI